MNGPKPPKLKLAADVLPPVKSDGRKVRKSYSGRIRQIERECVNTADELVVAE
jgi:hypothetical protein